MPALITCGYTAFLINKKASYADDIKSNRPWTESPAEKLKTFIILSSKTLLTTTIASASFFANQIFHYHLVFLN